MRLGFQANQLALLPLCQDYYSEKMSVTFIRHQGLYFVYIGLTEGVGRKIDVQTYGRTFCGQRRGQPWVLQDD